MHQLKQLNHQHSEWQHFRQNHGSLGYLANRHPIPSVLQLDIKSDITAEYTQYDKNLVLSAIAPETMVAVVAQNTRLNTKFDQSKFA